MTDAWRKANPERAKAARDAWRGKNKKRISELAKKLRDANPEPGRKSALEWNRKNSDRHKLNKRRFYQKHKKELLKKGFVNKLMREFGLTEQEYNSMLGGQGGVCAICGKQQSHDRRLCVDHDHDENVIRGLLCGRCNIALGLFGDNTMVLLRALEYLIKFKPLITERNNLDKVN